MEQNFYNGTNMIRRDFLKTDRNLILYLVLSVVTCNIYSLFFMASLVDDINYVAFPRDGKRTMNFWLLTFVLVPITCGIAYWVWMHNLANRVGDEARSRGIQTDFSAVSFWLWNVLGSFIVIGPFIYLHMLFTTMNSICTDYNQNGC